MSGGSIKSGAVPNASTESGTEVEECLLKQSKSLEKYLSEDGSYEPWEGGSAPTASAGIRPALERLFRAQEMTLKKAANLEKQVEQQRLLLENVKMERDILQQRLLESLEVNSRLKGRLEGQRCRAIAMAATGIGRRPPRDSRAHSPAEAFRPGNPDDRAREQATEARQRDTTRAETPEQAAQAQRLRQQRLTFRSCGVQVAVEGSPLMTRHQEKHHGFPSGSRFTGLGEGDASEKKRRPAGESRSRQLKALKVDLASVSKKLRTLKCELAGCGRDARDPTRGFDAPPDGADGDPKTRLRDILDDAMSLRAKLQVMKDEKQRKNTDRPKMNEPAWAEETG